MTVIRSLMLVCTLGLAALASSSTWLAIAGWHVATIDGSTYTAGYDALPTGWSYALEDNEYIIRNVQSGMRKANQSGTDPNESLGSVTMRFMYHSNDSALPQASYRVLSYYEFSAEANTEKTGAFAMGISKIHYWSTASAVSSDMGPGTNVTINKGPIKSVGGLSWTGSAGSWDSQVLYLPLPPMVSFGSASNNGGSGNWTCAYAKGTCKARVQVSLQSLNIARAEGSTNAKGIVTAEPFINNVSQGVYSGEVASGSYGVNFDVGSGTMTVKFWSPGALRKAVSLTLTDNQTSTGNTVTLKYGDLNGDNYVSQAEVDYIYSKIGTQLNSITAILSAGDPYNCALADFDQDGTVTSSDWAEADDNVGVTGD